MVLPYAAGHGSSGLGSLATAGATVVAAGITGIVGASLKHGWDNKSDERKRLLAAAERQYKDIAAAWDAYQSARREHTDACQSWANSMIRWMAPNPSAIVNRGPARRAA